MPTARERRPEQVEQPRRIVGPLGRQQLLGLVERQHERGLGPVEREAQLPGERQQLARPVRPGQAGGDRLEAGRAPVGRKGPGERLGERAQGVARRGETAGRRSSSPAPCAAAPARPARISDDLPLPEAPVISSSLGEPVAWRRIRRSASTACQLSSDRPKKIAASSTSNAARPG